LLSFYEISSSELRNWRVKPPLIGGALPAALLFVHRRTAAFHASHGTRKLAVLLAPLVSVGIGLAIPIAACAVWFLATGAMGDLYDTLFVFTPHYTALGWAHAGVDELVVRSIVEWLVLGTPVLLFGILMLVVWWPTDERRTTVIAIAAMLAIQLVGIAMQAKFFPYHYGAIWGLTALLAALGLAMLSRALASKSRLGQVLLLTVIVALLTRPAGLRVPDESFATRTLVRLVAVMRGLSDSATLDRLASAREVRPAVHRAVATFLREHVPANRSVLVWGFEPVIYDLAERRAATRYIYNIPQRVEWATDMRDRFMRDMMQDPPAVIVVEHGDHLSWVTGSNFDSAESVAQFPAFAELLATGYQRVEPIANFDVFVEKLR